MRRATAPDLELALPHQAEVQAACMSTMLTAVTLQTETEAEAEAPQNIYHGSPCC
jgi:hypothetical protein